MGRCPAIFERGLDPAAREPRAQAEEVSRILEARWRSGQEVLGREEGAAPHCSSPPPPSWHHKARSRVSPVPALTSRQRRRILSHAIWHARRSPEHCGGRGEGAVGQVPTQSQGEVAGPPPPAALEDSRWGRGLRKGVAGAFMLQEEASSVPN